MLCSWRTARRRACGLRLSVEPLPALPPLRMRPPPTRARGCFGLNRPTRALRRPPPTPPTPAITQVVPSGLASTPNRRRHVQARRSGVGTGTSGSLSACGPPCVRVLYDDRYARHRRRRVLLSSSYQVRRMARKASLSGFPEYLRLNDWLRTTFSTPCVNF